MALADYTPLKALAWQVQGTDRLIPVEAHDFYERNARHLNEATMGINAQALQVAFGKNAEHI